ncbi:MAG TPA: trypsin-like serine protease [Jatrophihabitans sp.]|nr:trypsin-like serine protease [Jatrophihabitans sp.]
MDTAAPVSMRSNVTGGSYVITAGHCGVNTWYDEFSSDLSWHVVGPTHQVVYGTDLGDEQLLYINNSIGWQEPNNYVLVYSSSGARPTTSAPLYTITGWNGGDTPYGTYVCHTGATSLTSCGMVVDDRAQMTPQDGYHQVDLLKVEGGTVCAGDSGGAVYAGHLAYGIVMSGSLSSGSTEGGPNGVLQPCTSGTSGGVSDTWYVTQIGNILAQWNISLVTR